MQGHTHNCYRCLETTNKTMKYIAMKICNIQVYSNTSLETHSILIVSKPVYTGQTNSIITLLYGFTTESAYERLTYICFQSINPNYW